MTKREAALILLGAIDEKGPVNINWNHAEMWRDVLLLGLTRIEREIAEEQNSQTAGTVRESKYNY